MGFSTHSQLCVFIFIRVAALVVCAGLANTSKGAILPNGILHDEQSSIVYNIHTGEVAVDASSSASITSISLASASGIFTGDPAANLGGAFDIDRDTLIFKATFGSSFGSLSFGTVARPNLDMDFLLSDLTAIGSLDGGGDLGDVDFVYQTSLSLDCNFDGVINVKDANCATIETLDATLQAANLVKGDADGKDGVQFEDFLIVATNFGSPGQYTDGDFDKSGDVQFADFLLLSANFGKSATAVAAVPEPNAAMLLLVGLVSLVRQRSIVSKTRRA